MISTRAILVSEDQRNIHARLAQLEPSKSDQRIADAYDNAGDQPRWEVCLAHDPFVHFGEKRCAGTHFNCRVVSAIIVPIEEDA